jgi:ribosomal protein S18 acetylase RimI-like enzyme
MGKFIYRPMDEQEFEKYLKPYLEDYINDISQYQEEFVEQVGMEPREFAEKQFNESLPHGLKSPGNYFWIIVNQENAEEIGYFWFSLIPEKNLCVISTIKIHDKYQNFQEYGTKILDFIEKYVKKIHPEINQLYLHVFRHKSPMKEFYESYGFQVFFESFEGFNLIKLIS